VSPKLHFLIAQRPFWARASVLPKPASYSDTLSVGLLRTSNQLDTETSSRRDSNPQSSCRRTKP